MKWCRQVFQLLLSSQWSDCWVYLIKAVHEIPPDFGRNWRQTQKNGSFGVVETWMYFSPESTQPSFTSVLLFFFTKHRLLFREWPPLTDTAPALLVASSYLNLSITNSRTEHLSWPAWSLDTADLCRVPSYQQTDRLLLERFACSDLTRTFGRGNAATLNGRQKWPKIGGACRRESGHRLHHSSEYDTHRQGRNQRHHGIESTMWHRGTSPLVEVV